MKKMFAWGIVVLAISLGFTACGEKGGTLKLINDTGSPYSFSILFDGTYQKVNNGATQIQPNQTIQAVSNEDTSYVVYGSGSYVLWTGSLSGGETVEKRFSEHQ